MTEIEQLDRGTRRRQVAREIQRRMVAHVAAGGTTDLAPRPMENAPAAYTDPGRAETERRELFLRRPLVVGLTSEIAKPGDCLLFEELGQSIIVVRGRDGVARAFLNMCTHRATKLVQPHGPTCSSSVTRFTCPFHAWTFDLEGRLVAVPGRHGFDGIDLTERGLVPVPVAEWNGVIFLRPTAGTDAIDVAEHLGIFAPELELLDFKDATPVRTSTLTAATNWKCAIDTYGEGYHFATLHASTIGVSHFSNVAVFDAFATHWRLNFPEKSLRALVDRPEGEWPEPDYGGIHFLFPNTILVVGSLETGTRWVRMFRIFPGSTPGSMSCTTTVYVLGGVASDAMSDAFATDDSTSDVTQEDYRVAVDGYANLVTAPPGFKVVYGRNEPALQAFHRSVAAAIGIRM